MTHPCCTAAVSLKACLHSADCVAAAQPGMLLPSPCGLLRSKGQSPWPHVGSRVHGAPCAWDDVLQEYAALLEVNEMVQQRARQVLDLRNKGRPAVTGGLSQLDGADTRYRCTAASSTL